LLKVPIGQGVQEDKPGASAKKPALQFTQAVLPVVEAALPKGHAVQAPAPPLLNVPRGHCVGEEAEGPLKVPASACAQLEEPAWAAKVPSKQGTQVVGKAAPKEGEAVPAGQLMHPEEVCPAAEP
jgi:hypothetical protein